MLKDHALVDSIRCDPLAMDDFTRSNGSDYALVIVSLARIRLWGGLQTRNQTEFPWSPGQCLLNLHFLVCLFCTLQTDSDIRICVFMFNLAF